MILIVLGSPRKNGNSSILAQKLVEGAKENNAIVEEIYLHGLNIKPCSACDGCRREPRQGCIVKDDMQPLYKKIEDADTIVLVSPIYWFNISAQMKIFIDRTYATEKDGKFGFTGKNIGIILTYADPDIFASGGVNALRSYQDIFKYVKAKVKGVIHGSAWEAGEISKNEKLLTQAYELGKKLTKKGS
jgi:multimeric flavodoxin WrbA